MPANTSPPLKIGFVFDDSLDSTDGVAQYVKTLGAWLSRQGHQVRYLVGETKLKDWAGGQVYSLSRNRQVTFNANRLTTPLPAKRARVKAVLAAEDFDVLHVQMPFSPLLAGRIIGQAGSAVGIVATVHILPASRLVMVGARVLAIAQRASLKRLDEVISVTKAAAGFAKAAFGLASQVLPNVVELARFQVSPRRSPKHKQIVFLGRLVERKGAKQLLTAFARLHQTMPAVKLVIAGDGPQRSKLERFVSQRRLGESVEFLGFIDEVDKPRLLASATIACFPSLYGESFGIVLLEAMAAGAGVVLGGDNPGYRSVIGEQPVLLVDPRDSQQFAERLTKLLTERVLAEGLHAWQTEFVKDFDVEVVGPKIVKLYCRAIAKRAQTKA